MKKYIAVDTKNDKTIAFNAVSISTTEEGNIIAEDENETIIAIFPANFAVLNTDIFKQMNVKAE